MRRSALPASLLIASLASGCVIRATGSVHVTSGPGANPSSPGYTPATPGVVTTATADPSGRPYLTMPTGPATAAPSTDRPVITAPTSVPTTLPTVAPTSVPTSMPSTVPTTVPSVVPSTVPTAVPGGKPTTIPTTAPSVVPSTVPTAVPGGKPTTIPTTVPSGRPPTAPTTAPTTVPTATPPLGRPGFSIPPTSPNVPAAPGTPSLAPPFAAPTVIAPAPGPTAPPAATRQPRIVVGEPSIQGGGLSRDAVKGAMGGQSGRLQLCYEAAHRRNPAVAGSMTVRFTVEGDGSVKVVDTPMVGVPDLELSSCVRQTVGGLRFPPRTPATRVTIDHPIQFEVVTLDKMLPTLAPRPATAPVTR